MGKVIGYTQGTYDMFHIGHLNLIKNAKRRCDYLIVGVNTDELVESYKNKRPIVPLEERAEIVRSIKYVDEVIITKEMEALGARLVYLPYTKDTSSTMLREKLKEY